jgi:hypothetical protein
MLRMVRTTEQSVCAVLTNLPPPTMLRCIIDTRMQYFSASLKHLNLNLYTSKKSTNLFKVYYSFLKNNYVLFVFVGASPTRPQLTLIDRIVIV